MLRCKSGDKRAGQRHLGSLLGLATVGLCLLAPVTMAAELSGELRKWHRVTLTMDGPLASETGQPNPFTDFRLEVLFTHADRHQQFLVPGFFAADGAAAYTSAAAGTKWRVNFAPNATGAWHWKVSFRTGKDVALADDPLSGKAWKPLDGASGSFVIAPSDKTGRDLRATGRVMYVGERYLRFAETGTYFLKAGADSPENLLAYDDFDATPNKGNRRKSWAPHAADYSQSEADLLWGPNRDKGRNLLGAINYLASEGMNAFSFLTFNVDGDDGNVFPHILKSDMDAYEATEGKSGKSTDWEQYVHHTRFDVSKLDQWEQVFSHGDRKGMYLHFKMQETEVDHKMDEGDLGRERRAYFREMIARFAHHLALNWNLGEENTQSTEQVKAMAQYVRDLDPYDHNIVLHTFPDHYDKVYTPLLGTASALTGLSIQTSQPDFSRVHGVVKTWVKRAEATGKPWVVACDEPGDPTHGLVPDLHNPQHDNARKNALWGTLMAGGAGVEFLFGYGHEHSDLTCQDWRSRHLFWGQCGVALKFFEAYGVPLPEMHPADEISDDASWVIASNYPAGEWVAVVYLPAGGSTTIALPEGEFSHGWFNPRSGEGMDALLASGRIEGGSQTFTAPDDKDWVLLLVQGNALPISKYAYTKATEVRSIE